MSSHVSRWLKALEDLPQVHRRLSTVVVDEQDGIRCIRQWDGVQTLFYVDPPYVGAEDYYQGGFKAEDHQRLSEALNGLQGKVVLSYYPCDLVEKLYPSRRWHKTVVETIATACGNAANRTGKKSKARDCQKRTELLLTNFDPRTRKRK